MTRCPPLRALLLLVVATLAAGAAQAACKLEKLLELPVTMTDMQPLVPAKVNGVDVVFMADSGAFFSQITPAKAVELELKPGPAPFGLVVRGVGGAEQKVAFVTARSFSVSDQGLAGSFLVGGGEMGHDAAGVIGQNILGVADVEYDLAHGAITVIRPHDCLGRALAYWSPGPDHSTLDIEAARARMTYGVAYVNGSRVRVLFDTGASVSMLTLAAARRAGLDPHAPGVVPAGVSRGIGRRMVQTWIAPVDRFKIGDEEIRRTRLRLSDIDSEDSICCWGRTSSSRTTSTWPTTSASSTSPTMAVRCSTWTWRRPSRVGRRSPPRPGMAPSSP